MALRLPPSAKNWISAAGAIIALTSLFMIVFLFTVTVILHAQAAYLGLVIYILLPGIMVMGLLCIPLGMFITTRRGLREVAAPEWPKIDLADPRHRNAALIFVVGTLFFVLVSAVGSYEAFHYTESVRFCGTLCHTVMEPEHVAHANSPHAKVACVACHVGPGADWYVRSKLSGLYQVYAVLTDVYPRPIPTPIRNLRPARAVCEQCHWPEQFYGQKQVMQTYYLPDKASTPWVIRLNMKIGPPEAAHGLIEGIHWHINPNIRMEYVAADKERQQIPWVRVTNLQTGEVKVFRDSASKVNDASLKKEEMRVMDCIDCHNRPAHRYRPPVQFINGAITAGSVSAALPEIKATAVEACSRPDATPGGVHAAIIDFYRNRYPELFRKDRTVIEKAAGAVMTEFSKNIFPAMKTRWSAYPDNIGHLYFSGCFRCHNGTHVSEKGERIRRDCQLCHELSSQGTPGKQYENALVGESLDFRHPEAIGDVWQETACNECHAGGNP